MTRTHETFRLLLMSCLALFAAVGCGGDPEPPAETAESTELPETSEEPTPLLQPPPLSVVSVTQQVETFTRRSLTFSNVGQGTLEWALQSDVDWIAFEEEEGVLGRRESTDVVVEITCPESAGSYEGLVRLDSNDLSRPRVNVTVTLTCTPHPVGSLEVRLTGLPGELAPPLQLVPRDENPELETVELEAEFLNTGIRPGQYDVEFPEVISEDGVTTWVPEAERVGVEIRSNQSALVSTRYQRIRAELDVEIVLGDDAPDGRVRITGPDAFERLLSASATLEDLIPGVYRIEAQSRVSTDDLGVWSPDPDEEVLTLRSGEAQTHTVTYGLIRGAIAVGVAGLPTDLDADIAVEGPGGFAETVRGGDVLEELAPGRYVFTAPVVTRDDGLESFAPTFEERVIQLASGASRSVDFSYVVGRGSLRVEVQGALPSGRAAKLVLEGPDDFEESFGFGRTFEGLAAGAYTLRGEEVTLSDGIRTFRPDQSEVSFTLASNAHEEISILYEELLSSLRVNVFGDELPESGVPLNTRIVGPGGFAVDLSSRTQTFENIPPGDYAVRSGRIQVPGGEAFNPRFNVQEVNVRLLAGATEPVVVGVEYLRVSTTLELDIRGLPETEFPQIRVVGPGDFDETYTQSTALLDLTPGEYTVFASNVPGADGITTWRPGFQQRTVTLLDEATTQVVVQFTPQPGILATTFVGDVPDGAIPRFVVSRTEPSPFQQTFERGQTVPPLLPASYEVRALELSLQGGIEIWSAVAEREEGDSGEGLPDDTVALQITSGQTSTASFRYERVPGELEVLVEGLPGALDPVFTITGGGASISPGAEVLLDDLTPGTYQIGVGDVTEEETEARYQPVQRTISVTVRSGERTSVTIVYEGQPGLLTLSASGLPTGVQPDAVLVGPLNDPALSVERPIVQASAVFPDLPIGLYRLRVYDISRESGTRLYAFEPEGGPANVDTDSANREYRYVEIDLRSGDRPFVNVRYRLQPGSVELALDGLEEGVEFLLRLTGPASAELLLSEVDFDEDFTWTGDLAPGDWTVAVVEEPVLGTELRWDFGGDAEDLSFSVDSSVSIGVLLAFEQTPGALQFLVSGVDRDLDDDLVIELVRADGEDCGEVDASTATSIVWDAEGGNHVEGLAPGLWCITTTRLVLAEDKATYVFLTGPASVAVRSGDNGGVELRYLRLSFRFVIVADNLKEFIYTLVFDPEEGDVELIEVDEFPGETGSVQLTVQADTGDYSVHFSDYSSFETLPSFPRNQACEEDPNTVDPEDCRELAFLPGARMVFPALQAEQTVTIVADDFDIDAFVDDNTGGGGESGELVYLISAWYEHLVPEFSIEVQGLDPGVSPAAITLSLVHPFIRGDDPGASCPPEPEDELEPCVAGEEEACLADDPQRGLIGSGDTWTPASGTPLAIDDELWIGCYRYTTDGTITQGGRSYDLEGPAEGYVLLGPDQAPQNLAFTYAPDEEPATLQVVVAGSFPGGVTPSLTLTGPFGFSETFSATRTFEDLRTGTYTVTANVLNATVDGVARRWTPSSTSLNVTLQDDDDETRTITYSEVLGSLAIALADLPGALNAGVSVTGPGGFDETVDSASTLSDLQPGTYRIQAPPVAGSGGTWIADDDDFTVAVAFGAPTNATVEYSFEPESSD